MTRTEVTAAKRVVVKVGSSSLTTAEGGIDPARMRVLVDVLVGARAQGVEVVLVSSGAIAAGLAPLRMKRRPKALPAQQAAASVGQGLLVHRYTEELAGAFANLIGWLNKTEIVVACRDNVDGFDRTLWQSRFRWILSTDDR